MGLIQVDHDGFWTLLFANRAECLPVVGGHRTELGASVLATFATPNTRSVPITIVRLSYTTVGNLLPSDAAAAGYLGYSELLKELQRQKPDLSDADVVTLVFFKRVR